MSHSVKNELCFNMFSLQPGLSVGDGGTSTDTRHHGDIVLWRIGICGFLFFSYGCAFVPYDQQIDQEATNLYKDTYAFLLPIKAKRDGSSKSEYYAHVKFYNDAASRLATLKLRAEIESTSAEQDVVQLITSLQEAYGTLASTDQMNGLNSTALSVF
jgi:hypothetical protein